MGSLIQRENGIYYGVFTARGKRVWRSTGARNPEEAKVAYLALSRQYDSWKGLTVLGFLEEIEGLLAGKLARSTVRLYTQTLKRFAERVGDLKLNSLSTYHVERFNAERAKVVSATKVRIDFRVLKAAFNRAVRYGMMEHNPCVSCERPRVPEKLPRHLSAQEVDRLITSVDDPQMRAIILLALATAMRLGEIVNLRWEDVMIESGMIGLSNRSGFQLKTGKGRAVPLSQFSIALLGGIPTTSEFVFPSRTGKPYTGGWVSRRFKRYVRESGLSEEIHFHSLRHTGATWLVQQNVPLVYVKEILGHSSVTTTMIYAHSDTGHLRALVDRVGRGFNSEWLNGGGAVALPDRGLVDNPSTIERRQNMLD